MSKLIKVIGLLFLPLAALLFVFAFIAKTGKNGKNVFVQEYDEQNIYG